MGSTSEPAQSCARSLSVLLVEDSRQLAERLGEIILAVPGASLAGTVDNEADAVAILHHEPVDVVLLDINLRQGSGFGVLRAIGHEQTGNMVAIVMTNHALAEYRHTAAALGAQHFLDKLRDLERLPALLKQISLRGGEHPSGK